MILELGGNDGLRGLPVTQMQNQPDGDDPRGADKPARACCWSASSCRPTTARSTSQSVRGGVPRAGEGARHRAGAVLLEDFADKPEFFLPDRLHPSEAAQPLMLERVWKALGRFLIG